MAGNLTVTPEQLNALSGQVTKSAGEIRGMHQGLKSNLAPLFGMDWKGAASAQFQSLYEQFDKSANSLTDALEGIGRLLSSAGQSYAEAEQQIASTFRG
jgi:WXG100 family type VII secretion target